MIFFGVVGTFTAAVTYDKREKRRATAKWARAVSHLGKEPMADPNQLPRKLTIFLESPPGDTMRAASEHFLEYVKPILAASGLDWEFVQGRQQGDVRAAVAEKIRRLRKIQERPDEELLPTEENLIEAVRTKNAVQQWEGIRGDVVIGRHTWKEYIRGLHEGWLGPLDPPIVTEPEITPAVSEGEGEVEEKKVEEKKPTRPQQPKPYNSVEDYNGSIIPNSIPAEFSPSTAIKFPHVLGFSSTFTRLGRFLNRRALADEIGREVAAVCLGMSREWREGVDLQYEQQGALEWEEKDWPKETWKQEEKPKDDEKPAEPPKEKIWPSSMVFDSRIATRMRRFELDPLEETRVQNIVVPEEEVEGWIKNSIRHLFRWGMEQFKERKKIPNVGNVDEE
jgi:mitochondrial import inner membrane translocase subunit TIM54